MVTVELWRDIKRFGGDSHAAREDPRLIASDAVRAGKCFSLGTPLTQPPVEDMSRSVALLGSTVLPTGASTPGPKLSDGRGRNTKSAKIK